MKKKNYIFTNKRHTKRGIMSVILGTISLAALGTTVFLAYLADGETPTGYGFTGLFSLLFSLTGEALGILTVGDKNYYRLFPVLGILLNLASLGGISLILYAGANL